MNRILHRLARSPHPRVMASLAWLILVINPVAVYGAPLGMMHGVHSRTLPVAHVAQVSDQCHHAAPVKADHSCCSDHNSGGTMNHTCSCAAVCCSALPAMAMAGVPAVPISTMHWAPLRADLRSSNRAPPLRPPPV